MKDKFVKLGESTYFTFNHKDNRVFCTHGSWGGKLVINPDNTCHVNIGGRDKIKYSKYEFLDQIPEDMDRRF